MKGIRNRLFGRLTLPGLLSALIILLNLVFAFSVIGPQETRLTALEERNSDLRKALHGPAGGDALEKTAAAVEAFKKNLPDNRALTTVIADVHRTARLNGLRVPEGDYRPETVKEAGISKYTLGFPLEGSYRQIKKLIYDLETSRYPLTVEELTLSSTSSEVGTISLTLRISIYFL